MGKYLSPLSSNTHLYYARRGLVKTLYNVHDMFYFGSAVPIPIVITLILIEFRR